jgi:hypothetical protein
MKMNNRYTKNRRRNYGNREVATNGASSIVTLIFLLIILLIWIIRLKSDISNISSEKEMLKSENIDLLNKIDSLSEKPVPIKVVPVVEIKPKKIFKKQIKDTTKTKAVEIIEIQETVADTAKLY